MTPRRREVRTLRRVAREKSGRFVWAALGLSLSVALAGRLPLPDLPNAWGVIDDLALAAATLAFLGACALLKKTLGCAVGISGVALLIVLSFANGWYFEFYRGFLELSSRHLLSDLGEAETSVAALFSPWSLLVIGGLFAGFGRSLLGARWPGRRAALGVIAMGLGAAAALQAVHGLRPSKVFHPTAESFLPRLWRKALAPAARPFTRDRTLREGRIALASLVPERRGWFVVDERYPLYQAPVAPGGNGNGRNLIVLVLEGVRASEMGAYGQSRSATPHLDRIARQGLFARRYYSNATQTIRAEVNLLCGLFDHLGGAPFSARDVPWDATCLPAILRRRGYATYWFHGYRSAFFRRDRFFPRIGFETLHDLDVLEGKMSGRQRLGWGIRDPVLYDHALEVLERSPRPFFAEILSLSNHFPFRWNWGIDFPPALDGSDRELFYNYRRGIYYTDHGVGHFWRRFQRSGLAGNTIVVIVGDHGIWTFDPATTGQLDDFNRHEQVFRVPFIALGPGIAPGTLDVAVSHVDVFPTLLSWLGVDAPTATLGRPFAGPGRTLETRSIFTLVEGTYGYRRDDLVCVPTGRTCVPDGFPRCREGERPSYGRACVRTKADLLLTTLDGGNAERVEAPDLEEADRLIGFMQRVLEEADVAPGERWASP
jgi:phosphoglycerol transferase MdoB-like AlkP superfamily enzyme